MKFENVMDPEILKARSSGQIILVIFGLPFFAAGCFVIAAALGFVPIEGDAPAAMMIPFGSVFWLVGLTMMTGRSGTTIDKRKGTVLKWYGLLVPMIRKEYRLGDYGRVSLRKETRRSKNSTTIVYPVRLEGKGDVKTIDFDTNVDYNESRATAETLCKFLAMPLSDFSTGTEVVREHDKLDESVADRIKRTGETLDLPDPPPLMKSRIEEHYGELKIDIPPPGMNPLHYLQLALPFAFFGFVAIFIFGGSDSPPPLMVGLIALFFFGIPFTVMLFKVLAKAKKGYVVTVDKYKLKIEMRGWIGAKTTEIPTDQIEELEMGGKGVPEEFAQMLSGGASAPADSQIPPEAGQVLSNPKVAGCMAFLMKMIPGPQIVVRSDKATVEFGRGLAGDELAYIHAAIKKTIAQ